MYRKPGGGGESLRPIPHLSRGAAYLELTAVWCMKKLLEIFLGFQGSPSASPVKPDEENGLARAFAWAFLI